MEFTIITILLGGFTPLLNVQKAFKRYLSVFIVFDNFKDFIEF